MQLPDLEKNILPWIGKTAKMMAIFMMEKFKQHHLDLTLEQLIILKILHDEDGRPQHDLALVTERHKASLTRLIGTMEKKNLVIRIPHKTDKRVNCIFLTKHGRDYFQSTLPILREAMQDIQTGLGTEEVNSLIQTLKKVQTNLKV